MARIAGFFAQAGLAASIFVGYVAIGCARHEIPATSRLHSLVGRCIELTKAEKIVASDHPQADGFLVDERIDISDRRLVIGELPRGERLVVRKIFLDDSSVGEAYVQILASPLNEPAQALLIRTVFDSEWLSAVKYSALQDNPNLAPDIERALDFAKARWCVASP